MAALHKNNFKILGIKFFPIFNWIKFLCKNQLLAQIKFSLTSSNNIQKFIGPSIYEYILSTKDFYEKNSCIESWFIQRNPIWLNIGQHSTLKFWKLFLCVQAISIATCSIFIEKYQFEFSISYDNF